MREPAKVAGALSLSLFSHFNIVLIFGVFWEKECGALKVGVGVEEWGS